MLIRFHILLVASGVLFCLGFGALELARHLRSGRTEDLAMSVAAAAGGLGLGVYLYRVLRYGVRG